MSQTCYYHPDNNLHNFCVNKQCALPLCPRCINIHLSQSNKKHHIQQLSQTKQMIHQQLETSLEAIQHHLKTLQVFIYDLKVKSKVNILHNIVSNNIQVLYKNIDNKPSLQLMIIIRTSNDNCLNSLKANIIAIQLILSDLWNKICYSSNKPIQSMIKIVSQQTIAHMEKFLQHISEKKVLFKMELPRLEGIQDNKIRIISGGYDKHAKQINQDQEISSRQFQNSKLLQETSRIYNQYNQLTQLQKINQLEAKLYSLRNSRY